MVTRARNVTIKQSNPGWLSGLLRRYREQDVLALGYPASETGSLRYPDGTPVVLVAAVNNFGSASKGIPARPFIHEGAVKAVEETQPVAAALVPALNAGKISKAQILEHMGPVAVGAQQSVFTEVTWEPNAQRTIDEKESAQPLIDTGLLRQSATYEVRKK